MFDYSHLVHVDSTTNIIYIYRVYADGKKHLYTEVPFAEFSEEKSLDVFKELSQMLGENILIDSQCVRKHFDLE